MGKLEMIGKVVALAGPALKYALEKAWPVDVVACAHCERWLRFKRPYGSALWVDCVNGRCRETTYAVATYCTDEDCDGSTLGTWLGLTGPSEEASVEFDCPYCGESYRGVEE